MSRQATILEEISTLRRLIRRTRRGIRLGTIDPLQGGRLITRTTALLARLVRLQDTVNFNAHRKADEIRMVNQILKASRTMIYTQKVPDPTKP
jgi:hypothetical protein